ncbi:pro-sigmaK processing inhibitor BofA family protein [Peptoniphilus catoniae]|uniref:pro-sigmaK processing inhibitor BofA family protein n=1 Tax=Peptoniphilus catoniae TaxID=1660341 RepID=UPI0010FE45F9|nr:pro-sigmaK processing inhibitor BofA family protein [Peptoniphilus catoniae]
MSFLAGGIISLLIITLIFKSIGAVIGLIFNIIGGGVLLYLFNLIGSKFGLVISITPVTAFLAGFFGVPAVAVMILIKLFL